MKKILVLAPHMDDEHLGMGGYLYDAIRKNHQVYVHVFTCGGPCSNVSGKIREAEFNQVMDELGVPEGNRSFEVGRDGELSQLPNSSITKEIDDLYDRINPSEVFCNYRSVHTDHIAVYNAFMASLRLRSGYNPPNAYLYEYPFLLTDYHQPDGGKVYYPLSKDTFNEKCRIFELYKSQCKPYPSPLGVVGIKTLAQTRGLEAGEKYAECFYSLRQKIKL